MIITIDGPAASGKSSVARILALRLKFYYLYTGLLYRAVARLLVQRYGIDFFSNSCSGPFKIDSKAPNWDRYREFLMNEARYAQLLDINPDSAEALFEANLNEAKRKYKMYTRYAAMDYGVEQE